MTATAVVATVGDAHEFSTGRQFAAWLGLTPRQSSSGGKTRLGGISKRGNVYLRTLLVHGARSVLQLTESRSDRKSQWAVSYTHLDVYKRQDITYIHVPGGFVYLAAILGWYSRKVLAWRLSNTLETRFCLDGLEEALGQSQPIIFNTDQGTQFTSLAFTRRLAQAGIQISMDGRGRAHDNIFVERLWRSVKYEEVYPKAYDTLDQAYQGLEDYFKFYNDQRPHQALNNRTPAEVYADRQTLSP